MNLPALSVAFLSTLVSENQSQIWHLDASQYLIVQVFLANTSRHLCIKYRTLYKSECKKCRDWIDSQQLSDQFNDKMCMDFVVKAKQFVSAHDKMFLVLPLSFQSKLPGEGKKRKEDWANLQLQPWDTFASIHFPVLSNMTFLDLW